MDKRLSVGRQLFLAQSEKTPTFCKWGIINLYQWESNLRLR